MLYLYCIARGATICKTAYVCTGVNIKENSGNWSQIVSFSLLFLVYTPSVQCIKCIYVSYFDFTYYLVKCRWNEYRSIYCANDRIQYTLYRKCQIKNQNGKLYKNEVKKSLKKKQVRQVCDCVYLSERNRWRENTKINTRLLLMVFWFWILFLRFQLPWGIFYIILRINRLPRLNSTTIHIFASFIYLLNSFFFFFISSVYWYYIFGCVAWCMKL